MLIDNEWFKCISVDKMLKIMNELSENTHAKYITTTRVGELAILNSNFNIIGIIQITDEDINWL